MGLLEQGEQAIQWKWSVAVRWRHLRTSNTLKNTPGSEHWHRKASGSLESARLRVVGSTARANKLGAASFVLLLIVHEFGRSHGIAPTPCFQWQRPQAPDSNGRRRRRWCSLAGLCCGWGG